MHFVGMKWHSSEGVANWNIKGKGKIPNTGNSIGNNDNPDE